MDLQILGIDKLKRTQLGVSKMRQTIRDAMVQETRQTGEDIVATAKRDYLSGRPGLNVRTGRLRSSITYQVRNNGDLIDLSVGSNVIYARIHEYGGDTGRNHKTYIPPRPYLGPSFAENKPAFSGRIASLLKDIANEAFAA